MAFDRAEHERRKAEGLKTFAESAKKLRERNITPGEPRYYEPSGFGYARDFDLTLPSLVLAADPRTVDRGSFIEGERPWFALVHQTGGHACHHPKAIVTPLTPHAQTWEAMIRLNSKWLDSQAGMWSVTLNEVVEYRSDLQDLFDVDCNFTYRKFEEAWYPIDYSHENLEKLASDDLVEDPDDVITWDGGLGRFAGILNRWYLLVLGENSD